MVYSFYFLLVGSRRNEFNSLWWRQGGEIRRLLLARKVYLSGKFIYLLSYYSCYGLLFLFSVCGSMWMNSVVFGGEKGRGQKVVAYSDIVSAMQSLIIKWYRKLYHCTWWICHYLVARYRFSQNVCHTLYITHISQQECRGVLELECTINIRAISLLFCKMTIPFLFTVR